MMSCKPPRAPFNFLAVFPKINHGGSPNPSGHSVDRSSRRGNPTPPPDRTRERTSAAERGSTHRVSLWTFEFHQIQFCCAERHPLVSLTFDGLMLTRSPERRGKNSSAIQLPPRRTPRCFGPFIGSTLFDQVALRDELGQGKCPTNRAACGGMSSHRVHRGQHVFCREGLF